MKVEGWNSIENIILTERSDSILYNSAVAVPATVARPAASLEKTKVKPAAITISGGACGMENIFILSSDLRHLSVFSVPPECLHGLSPDAFYLKTVY